MLCPKMLFVVLFPCLVDPDKLGKRLLDACWKDNAEKAVQLIEKGEYICSATHGVITDSRHVTDIISLL